MLELNPRTDGVGVRNGVDGRESYMDRYKTSKGLGSTDPSEDLHMRETHDLGRSACRYCLVLYMMASMG